MTRNLCSAMHHSYLDCGNAEERKTGWAARKRHSFQHCQNHIIGHSRSLLDTWKWNGPLNSHHICGHKLYFFLLSSRKLLLLYLNIPALAFSIRSIVFEEMFGVNQSSQTMIDPDDPLGDYRVFSCLYMTREPRDCSNWVEKNGTACGRCLVRPRSFMSASALLVDKFQN